MRRSPWEEFNRNFQSSRQVFGDIARDIESTAISNRKFKDKDGNLLEGDALTEARTKATADMYRKWNMDEKALSLEGGLIKNRTNASKMRREEGTEASNIASTNAAGALSAMENNARLAAIESTGDVYVKGQADQILADARRRQLEAEKARLKLIAFNDSRDSFGAAEAQRYINDERRVSNEGTDLKISGLRSDAELGATQRLSDSGALSQTFHNQGLADRNQSSFDMATNEAKAAVARRDAADTKEFEALLSGVTSDMTEKDIIGLIEKSNMSPVAKKVYAAKMQRLGTDRINSNYERILAGAKEAQQKGLDPADFYNTSVSDGGKLSYNINEESGRVSVFLDDKPFGIEAKDKAEAQELIWAKLDSPTAMYNMAAAQAQNEVFEERRREIDQLVGQRGRNAGGMTDEEYAKAIGPLKDRAMEIVQASLNQYEDNPISVADALGQAAEELTRLGQTNGLNFIDMFGGAPDEPDESKKPQRDGALWGLGTYPSSMMVRF